MAPVGTIGLVRASREQEDGTSQLLLHGVMRVRFTEWHDDRDYPYASIEPVISVFTPENQSAGGDENAAWRGGGCDPAAAG